uniref:Uncharacterized protein n=1 Tax=Bionectria ochroleuca TaxID=29856 RepID=A0A8H7NJT3_BIOOC
MAVILPEINVPIMPYYLCGIYMPWSSTSSQTLTATTPGSRDSRRGLASFLLTERPLPTPEITECRRKSRSDPMRALAAASAGLAIGLHTFLALSASAAWGWARKLEASRKPAGPCVSGLMPEWSESTELGSR